MAKKHTTPVPSKNGHAGRPDGATARTEDEVRQALAVCKGLIHLTASKLGVTDRTMYNYLERWPDLKEAIKEQRELRVDVAELSLCNAVAKGEPWAVCFTLKTQGKNRGYTERHEITGKDGEELVIRVLGASVSMGDL